MASTLDCNEGEVVVDLEETSMVFTNKPGFVWTCRQNTHIFQIFQSICVWYDVIPVSTIQPDLNSLI